MHGHIIQFSWSQEHPVPTSSVTEVSSKLETWNEEMLFNENNDFTFDVHHMVLYHITGVPHSVNHNMEGRFKVALRPE